MYVRILFKHNSLIYYVISNVEQTTKETIKYSKLTVLDDIVLGFTHSPGGYRFCGTLKFEIHLAQVYVYVVHFDYMIRFRQRKLISYSELKSKYSW